MMVRFLRDLFRRKPRPFFHPSLIGESGRGWKVGPICTTLSTWGTHSPFFLPNASGGTVELEYQRIYHRSRITNLRAWCPDCGFELSEGTGAGPTNFICDRCQINYGTLDGYTGVGTRVYADRRPPNFHPPAMTRRRPKHNLVVNDIPDFVLAIFSEWEQRFWHLKPTIDQPGPAIDFWNKQNFWLCSVCFESDCIVLDYLMTCIYDSGDPFDDCPPPRTRIFGRGDEAEEYKVIDPINVPFYYDLNCPNSIAKIEDGIARIAAYYPDSYQKLLDRRDKQNRRASEIIGGV